MIDMTKTIEPNSEQINADDLVSGPRTVTVMGVKQGTAEQPVFIELAEFPGRTFRPAKTVRKLLIAGWGDDANKYVGRQLTIFNDTTVKWGGKEVGGIRVSHMSHITSAVRVNLMVTRGKREMFVVEPLETDDAAVLSWVAAMEAAADLDELQAAWGGAGKAGVMKDQRVIDAKNERKAALNVAGN